MVSYINPSNSHVLNTLVFNAGQLRRLFNDVTEMPVSSSVSSPFIKRLFVESEIYSTSDITSVPSVKFKYINTNIQSTSSVYAPVVRNKFINTSITGDTESVVYKSYRDSYTDVTSVEAFSDVEYVDSYINSYVENISTSTSDVFSAATISSYRNATIDETSTLTLDSIVRKGASVFIPGDTESVIYEPYRSSYTDVSAIEVSTNTSSVPSSINSYVTVSSSSSSTLTSVPSICFNADVDIELNSNITISSIIRKNSSVDIIEDSEDITYNTYTYVYTDVENISTTSDISSVLSDVNSYVESNTISTSEVSSSAVLTSYLDASIDTSSSIKVPAVIRKHAVSFIPGDTESVLYTVFRRSETDITSINTTSTLNIPFIVKKVFNTNINSNSIINNISMPVKKLFNTNINNTSNFNINTIKYKLININITGDTEAFSYTVYRDVNTGVTPIVTRSTVIVPTIIRHYYDVSNLDNITSLTYSLSKNIVRYSNIESVSSARVIIPATIFTDVSSITASTDSSMTTIKGKINSSSIINNTSTDSSAYRHRTFSSTIEKDSSVEYKVGRNKYIQSSFVDLSDVHLEQSGFLLYYKGRLKLFICPKSSPHHPEDIEYRVQGSDVKEYNSVNHNILNVMLLAEGSFKTASHHFDTQETIKDSFISICTKSAPRHPENITYKVKGLDKKETLPFNSFILGSNKYNEGSWLTSSYHFDTQETVKENTVLTIKKPKFVALSGCVEKPSLYFKASSSLLF